MELSDFDYDLPPVLIAREPIRPRDASRMLVLQSSTGQFFDSVFRNLPELLNPSDILVLNDTRVVRARMHGRLERSSGSSREIEVFFAEPVSANRWRVLCRPGRRIRTGDRVTFKNFQGVFLDSDDEQLHELLLGTETPDSFLEAYGELPLPPYIQRRATDSDATDYQTVFGNRVGAVAAPTAGLHFTDALIDTVRERGVEVVTITLHVGIGTFLPIRSATIEDHVLRAERFEISETAGERLRTAQHEGRRIVAVGTTTTRTLEFVMKTYGELRPAQGEADIFIFPGFQFRAVDALLTNFHLPRSTLLMLVSAFAGREAILSAYLHAVRERYRFYSFGDCMFLTR